MKILHIASFRGNIGDNASHMGLYSILDRLIKYYSLEKIEMRKFYKNYNKKDKKEFDDEFINFINRFDLCIIGGGGFLDYWVPGSQTGATFDIDPSLVRHIKTPTLFASMGCNPQKDLPEGNIDKFERFLSECIDNKKISIALRNDGSVKAIERDFGAEYLEGIVEILDHGFFYSPAEPSLKLLNEQYVAINIVSDQLEMRSSLINLGSRNDYKNELKNVFEFIVMSLGLHILFIPHIYSDLKAISEIVETLEDSFIRSYVNVAPCVQGDAGANFIFSLYKNSEFVIGTRLHSNVCSIAMEKKSIGLAALDRVDYLYRSLEIGHRSIKLGSRFGDKIINVLSNDLYLETGTLDRLRTETIEYYETTIGRL
jgi:polysaccharide pyruvyl transferase WcaK-like protein